MRPVGIAALIFVSVVACHGWRADTRAASPGEYCRTCCLQMQDACKLDSDRPGYYCPRQFDECSKACADNNENEMCVIDTTRKFAASAPRPIVASRPAPAPVASMRVMTPERSGECDKQGAWTLTLADARGRTKACVGLKSLPRDVSFRIERKREEYALRDLVPAPGWTDGFTVENQADRCAVTLVRTRAGGGEAPRTISIALTARDGKVDGTFRYVEEVAKPAVCELESKVSGSVEPPAPSPPSPAPPPPPPPREPNDQRSPR